MEISNGSVAPDAIGTNKDVIGVQYRLIRSIEAALDGKVDRRLALVLDGADQVIATQRVGIAIRIRDVHRHRAFRIGCIGFDIGDEVGNVAHRAINGDLEGTAIRAIGRARRPQIFHHVQAVSRRAGSMPLSLLKANIPVECLRLFKQFGIENHGKVPKGFGRTHVHPGVAFNQLLIILRRPRVFIAVFRGIGMAIT